MLMGTRVSSSKNCNDKQMSHSYNNYKLKNPLLQGAYIYIISLLVYLSNTNVSEEIGIDIKLTCDGKTLKLSKNNKSSYLLLWKSYK